MWPTSVGSVSPLSIFCLNSSEEFTHTGSLSLKLLPTVKPTIRTVLGPFDQVIKLQAFMTDLCVITGGSGYVGLRLARELLSQGYRVRIFDTCQPQRDKMGSLRGAMRGFLRPSACHAMPSCHAMHTYLLYLPLCWPCPYLPFLSKLPFLNFTLTYPSLFHPS